MGGLEERIRYSPYFLWHNGGRRIAKVLDAHDLDLPEKNLSILRGLCSSLMRDPWVLSMTVSGLASLTGVAGWFITTELMKYTNSKINYDSYHQTDEYKTAYAKNLAYAQSNAYLAKFEYMDKNHEHRVLGGLFNSKCHKYLGTNQVLDSYAHVNSTVYCQRDLLSAEMDNLKNDYGNLNDTFLNRTMGLYHAFFSFDEIKTFVCGVATEMCKKNVTFGEYFLRSSKSNAVMYLGACGRVFNCPWRVKSAGNGNTRVLIVPPITYDPACIADNMISMPDVLPYPTSTIIDWSLAIGGGWSLYFCLMFLGWCLFS